MGDEIEKVKVHYKTAKELNTDTVDENEYEKGIRKQLGSVWRIAVCQGNERLKDENGKKLHSTQKPEELLYRIIAISSNENDVVLDPFGGTMTTGAVAKRLGRNYIMIERDEKYYKYGTKRIEKEEYIADNISKAIFDERPIRVTMEEMIAAGYFQAGEKMFLKKGEVYAILTEDAKIRYRDEIYDLHHGAAVIKGAKADRLNGFTVWYVERDGYRVSIDEIREKYREDKLKR